MSRLQTFPFLARKNTSGSASIDSFVTVPRGERKSAPPVSQGMYFPAVRDPVAQQDGQFFVIWKHPPIKLPGQTFDPAWPEPDKAFIFPAIIFADGRMTGGNRQFYADANGYLGGTVFFFDGSRVRYQRQQTSGRVGSSVPGLFPDDTQADPYTCPMSWYSRRVFSGSLSNSSGSCEYSGTAEAAITLDGSWEWLSKGTLTQRNSSGTIIEETDITTLVPPASGWSHDVERDQTETRLVGTGSTSGTAKATLDPSSLFEFSTLADKAAEAFEDPDMEDLFPGEGFGAGGRPQSRCLISSIDTPLFGDNDANARSWAEIAQIRVAIQSQGYTGNPTYAGKYPLQVSFDLRKRRMASRLYLYSSSYGTPDHQEISSVYGAKLEGEMLHPEDRFGSMAMDDPSWGKMGWHAGPLPETRIKTDYRSRYQWKVFIPGSSGPYTVAWEEVETVDGTPTTYSFTVIATRVGQVWEIPPQTLWVDTTMTGHTRQIENLEVKDVDGEIVLGGPGAYGLIYNSLNDYLGTDAPNSEMEIGGETVSFPGLERVGIAVKYRKTPLADWGWEDYSQRGSAIPKISPRKFYRRKRSYYTTTRETIYPPSVDPPCGYEWLDHRLHTEMTTDWVGGVLQPFEKVAEYGQTFEQLDVGDPISEWSPNYHVIPAESQAPVISLTERLRQIGPNMIRQSGLTLQPANLDYAEGEIIESIHHEQIATLDPITGMTVTPYIYFLANDPGHTWGIENVVIQPVPPAEP